MIKTPMLKAVKGYREVEILGEHFYQCIATGRLYKANELVKTEKKEEVQTDNNAIIDALLGVNSDE